MLPYLVPTKVKGSNWFTLLHSMLHVYTQMPLCKRGTLFSGSRAWKAKHEAALLETISATPFLRQTLASFFTMLSGPWLPPSIPTIAPTLAPHSTLAHAGRTSPCGSRHCGKYQRQGPLWRPWRRHKNERASEGCVPHCSIRRLLDGYKTSLAQIKTNQGRVHYAILI